MKQPIKVGFVDYSTFVYIPDPASTDGSGKTGLVAANLTVSYCRMETDNDATVTDVTSSLSDLGALTTAHTDWGLKEVSNTLAPGLYRLDIADAVFASGAWTAVVYVMITTSAAAASPMEFLLVAYDINDTVRMGLTALPNAAADAAGGLPISDAGGLDLDAQRSNISDILVDTAEIGAAGAGLTNINLPDQTMNITGNITGNLTGSVGSVTGAVGSVTGAVGSVTGNVGGNVTGSVGSVVGAVGSVTAGVTLANDAITAAKFDETTAFPLKSDDSGATQVARVGADGDTLETLSDQLDAKASQTSVDDLPTNAELATALGTADDAILAVLGTPAGASLAADIAAIEAQTDDIGVAGAGLTAVPWNAAWDAEVQSEATDALNAYDPPTHAELVSEINDVQADIAALTIPTAADVADAVWEETLADHSGTAGSTAEQLAAAGAAGDPWATSLPGAYGAGTAGKIIGDNINATISSRLATSGYTAPPSVGAIADQVWDEALAGHAGAGSTGEALDAAATGGSAPTANENADALLDRANAIETGLTLRQATRLIAAATAGKISGSNTTTITIRNAVADSKDRLVATVTATGDRTAITTDVS